MPLLRPGIDVAVRTECRMLSTAAGLDFKQRIILVQARDNRVAALRLWQSFPGSGAAPHLARARMEECAWFGAG